MLSPLPSDTMLSVDQLGTHHQPLSMMYYGQSEKGQLVLQNLQNISQNIDVKTTLSFIQGEASECTLIVMKEPRWDGKHFLSLTVVSLFSFVYSAGRILAE